MLEGELFLVVCVAEEELFARVALGCGILGLTIKVCEHASAVDFVGGTGGDGGVGDDGGVGGDVKRED